MALIKCSECGKKVSDKASACPNCGNPVRKEIVISKVKKNTNDSFFKISSFVSNYKKLLITFVCVLTLLVVIFFFSYSYYLSKLNAFKTSVQGEWIYYWDYENSSGKEVVTSRKIKVVDDIIIDEYGDKYKIRWNPFSNSFSANNDTYTLDKDKIHLDCDGQYNYLKKDFEYNASNDLIFDNINFSMEDKTVYCSATISNISNYNYTYIIAEGEILNTKGNHLIGEDYEIKSLKPGESMNIKVQNTWYFYNTEEQWTADSCKFNIKRAYIR